MQCKDDDDDDVDLPEDTICQDVVIIDSELYKNTSSDTYRLSSATIAGDCLIINFGASGCSGSSWEYKMVDSGAVAESLPEQRFLKFQLVNNEDCLAFFTREQSFDIRPLQIEGSNQIILNIEGFSESLTYNY
ncbi:hypothetical protein H7U19_06000 [Hyunsoonleella sp. SJ7]|uniref:Uncharacterized protein n=1 Tax=Hyunsoonleella aquatilis TaxID=2762758 RepID=A0A923HA81_9FLAO|nr:hypothetical protein [Hyunsoonleella aquatilis]MBC3757947.1 hypothetical protein [Hyunsoonleella aquatilis]